jgi:hypothetical protein
MLKLRAVERLNKLNTIRAYLHFPVSGIVFLPLLFKSYYYERCKKPE